MPEEASATSEVNWLVAIVLSGFVSGLYTRPKGVYQTSLLDLSHALLFTGISFVMTLVGALVGPLITAELLRTPSFYVGLARVLVLSFIVALVTASVSSATLR